MTPEESQLSTGLRAMSPEESWLSSGVMALSLVESWHSLGVTKDELECLQGIWDRNYIPRSPQNNSSPPYIKLENGRKKFFQFISVKKGILEHFWAKTSQTFPWSHMETLSIVHSWWVLSFRTASMDIKLKAPVSNSPKCKCNQESDAFVFTYIYHVL